MTEIIHISPGMFVFAVLVAGLAGFVDAVAGGGGLLTLPAYLITGMPAHNAYAVNKFAAASGTFATVINYFRGGAMDFRAALVAAAGSFIGSAAAAQVVLRLSDATLRMLVLIAVPVVAVIIFSQRKSEDKDRSEKGMSPKKAAVALCIGAMVGAYDGLIGPGTGTFAIMAFASLMHYDLLTAGGNAKVINLASNVAALITFLLQGLVIFHIAIPCAVAMIVGAQIGSGMALTKGGDFIRPMMMVVVVMMLIKVAYDTVAAL